MSVSTPPRVEFHVLASSEPRARLKHACRLVEQAYLDGERVLVRLDPEELEAFDELLWTFADRSFVPHERFGDAEQWQHTPVLLSAAAEPAVPFDLLVNLAAAVPAAAALATRITELVDADEARRRAARERFRRYRDQGLAPQTREFAAEQ